MSIDAIRTMDGVGMRRRAMLCLRLLGPMIAAQFSLAYVYGTKFYVDLGAYAAGHARLPFQYRALVGWLMRALLNVPFLASALPPADQGMTEEKLIVLGIVFVSMLWLLHSAKQVAVKIVADRVLAQAMGLSFLVTIYLNYALPAYLQRLSYPYDIPSLALFFSAFIAIVEHRILRLIVLFAIATLARETSILLVPIMLCWNWPTHPDTGRLTALPAKKHAITAIAMAAIWALEKLFLHYLYGGNPTQAEIVHTPILPGAMELEFGSNMHDMLQFIRIPVILSEFCWLWLPVFMFWNHIDSPPLRRSLRAITPYWFIAMVLVGMLRETRIFAELTILYWMATLIVIRAICGLRRPDD